jgi:transposase
MHLEIEPVSFKVVGRLTGVRPKKLHRWYKEVLSGYVQAQQNGEIARHDIITRGGERKRVPILEPGHIGAHMAIDEKYLNEEFYTVLTNAETGKIALLAQTTDKKELVELVSQFGDKRLEVKTISRDLSPVYDWVCRESFWNAGQVADKFHVIKLAAEQLQELRIYLRQQELSRIKQQQAHHYKREFKKQQQAQQLGANYKVEKFVCRHPIMSNGETLLQLLARSRYLLFKMPNRWNENQQQRAQALFEYCPQLKQVYEIVVQLRHWYNASNIGKPKATIVRQLNKWYKQAKELLIDEVENIAALIQRHEGVILNYFIHGRTNAIAEATNNKLQRFISANYGIREIDFFFFRAKTYFASTSK